MRSIERTLQLSHFKWDTQVGDSSVLSPQALLIAEKEWAWLCMKAERAAQEMYAFEREIASSPALQRIIGVPRKLCDLLSTGRDENNMRTLRFDFHPTSTGWLISEVNSDVPGGFGEASVLPVLFEAFRGRSVAPISPLSVWGNLAEAEFGKGHIALLHAPGYLEDQQVVLVLGRELKMRGFIPHVIQSPEALHWHDGCACLARNREIRIKGVIRFFQAEWLAKLPARTGWKELFRGGATCVSNPLESVISESKRLPLSFKSLNAASDTWRELFPACREPHEIDVAERDEWVLKAAYSNTGDAVHIGAELPQQAWERLLRVAQRSPFDWVAQRRFETVTLESFRGPVRPCVGIFVIGKRAAGAYIRLSRTQVTDAYSLEAPLFVLPEEDRA
jgi:glutathionylspermidine synthase